MIPLTILVLLTSAAPRTAEHFRRDDIPTHFLLVVDAATGETVRADDSEAAEGEAHPPGEAARLLLALAGLEDGALDPEWTVACDSTCWGQGAHGNPALVEATAFPCDTYFREALRRVGRAAVARHAARAGFSPPSPEEARTREDFPGAGWGVTGREWVRFWRNLAGGNPQLRPGTVSTLLAAGGMAVVSPRSVARPLHDPEYRVRAVVGAAGEGAWVTGVLSARGAVRWAFALYVRGGTAPLAAARAAHLLEETLRTREAATRERGGTPLPPIDADR